MSDCSVDELEMMVPTYTCILPELREWGMISSRLFAVLCCTETRVDSFRVAKRLMFYENFENRFGLASTRQCYSLCPETLLF